MLFLPMVAEFFRKSLKGEADKAATDKFIEKFVAEYIHASDREHDARCTVESSTRFVFESFVERFLQPDTLTVHMVHLQNMNAFGRASAEFLEIEAALCEIRRLSAPLADAINRQINLLGRKDK